MENKLPPEWQEFYDQLPEYAGGTFEFVGGPTPWMWKEIGGVNCQVEIGRTQVIVPPFELALASAVIPDAPDELSIVFHACPKEWERVSHVLMPSAYVIHGEENGVLMEAEGWETKFRFKKRRL